MSTRLRVAYWLRPPRHRITSVLLIPSHGRCVSGSQSGACVLWRLQDPQTSSDEHAVGYVGKRAKQENDAAESKDPQWDLEPCAWMLAHQAPIIGLVMCVHDGVDRICIASEDGSVSLWDPYDGACIAYHPQLVGCTPVCMKVGMTNHFLIFAGKSLEIELVDLNTMRVVGVLDNRLHNGVKDYEMDWIVGCKCRSLQGVDLPFRYLLITITRSSVLQYWFLHRELANYRHYAFQLEYCDQKPIAIDLAINVQLILIVYPRRWELYAFNSKDIYASKDMDQDWINIHGELRHGTFFGNSYQFGVYSVRGTSIVYRLREDAFAGSPYGLQMKLSRGIEVRQIFPVRVLLEDDDDDAAPASNSPILVERKQKPKITKGIGEASSKIGSAMSRFFGGGSSSTPSKRAEEKAAAAPPPQRPSPQSRAPTRHRSYSLRDTYLSRLGFTPKAAFKDGSLEIDVRTEHLDHPSSVVHNVVVSPILELSIPQSVSSRLSPHTPRSARLRSRGMSTFGDVAPAQATMCSHCWAAAKWNRRQVVLAGDLEGRLAVFDLDSAGDEGDDDSGTARRLFPIATNSLRSGWDASPGRPFADDPITVSDIVFDAMQQPMLLTGHESGHLQWHSLPSNEQRGLLSREPVHNGAVTVLWVSSSGRVLFSGGAESLVCCWDLHSCTHAGTSPALLKRFVHHSGPVRLLASPPRTVSSAPDAATPATELICSIGDDGVVVVYQVSEDKGPCATVLHVLSGHPAPVLDLYWHLSQDTLVVQCEDGYLLTWQLLTGLHERTVRAGSAADRMLAPLTGGPGTPYRYAYEHARFSTARSVTEHRYRRKAACWEVLRTGIGGGRDPLIPVLSINMEEYLKLLENHLQGVQKAGIAIDDEATYSMRLSLYNVSLYLFSCVPYVAGVDGWQDAKTIYDDFLAAYGRLLGMPSFREGPGMEFLSPQPTLALRGDGGTVTLYVPKFAKGFGPWFSPALLVMYSISLVSTLELLRSSSLTAPENTDDNVDSDAAAASAEGAVASKASSGLGDLLITLHDRVCAARELYCSRFFTPNAERNIMAMRYYVNFLKDHGSRSYRAGMWLIEAMVRSLPEREVKQVSAGLAADFAKQMNGDFSEYRCNLVIAMACLGLFSKRDSPNPIIDRNVASYVALDLLAMLERDRGSQQSATLSLVANGFSFWSAYYPDAEGVILRIFDACWKRRVTGAVAAAVTVIHSEPALTFAVFKGRVGNVLVDVREQSVLLRLLARAITVKPSALLWSAAEIIEIAMSSLNPQFPPQREGTKDAAMALLRTVISSYPTVSFHSTQQRLAVGTVKGAIVIYDVRTCTRLAVLSAHNAPIDAVCLSPENGSKVAAYSSGERAVSVWSGYVDRSTAVALLSSVVGDGSLVKRVQLQMMDTEGVSAIDADQVCSSVSMKWGMSDENSMQWLDIKTGIQVFPSTRIGL